MKNKKLIRQALSITWSDFVISALPGNWLYWSVLLIISTPILAVSIYRSSVQKDHSSAVLTVMSLVTMGGLMRLVWNRYIMSPSVTDEEWREVNRRVRLYWIISRYASSCPTSQNLPALCGYMNDNVTLLMISARRWQLEDKGLAKTFWNEAKKLHAALRGAGMVESTDWAHYQR
jgi:hypothetical protein